MQKKMVEFVRRGIELRQELDLILPQKALGKVDLYVLESAGNLTKVIIRAIVKKGLDGEGAGKNRLS